MYMKSGLSQQRNLEERNKFIQLSWAQHERSQPLPSYN
uniref:Uncharacterized protein n=1 Tax=Rhizophora mucronata TaxID=61149 RepID=A0A2P2QE08_RHIMU